LLTFLNLPAFSVNFNLFACAVCNFKEIKEKKKKRKKRKRKKYRSTG
jgi:hypothetical protein